MSSLLISQLKSAYGFEKYHLEEIIRRAPFTYKFYAIPKRTGGVRIIAQPAKETKTIQRWLIANVFARVPVHDCATAYRAGTSIAKNAAIHSSQPYLVKHDIRNFFNSIKISDVVALLTQHISDAYDADDVGRMANICCVKMPDSNELCLSVGAPTSPLLSNAIMYEFDERVQSWSNSKGFHYTRYADDLTFSTDHRGISQQVQPFLETVLQELPSPSLRLNSEKIVHSSKKFQRRVTGLILANDGSVSLGRNRKREISALVHKYTLNALDDEKTYYLQGLLGFARDAEPGFVVRLSNKYGPETLTALFSKRKPKAEVRVITLEDLLNEVLGER